MSKTKASLLKRREKIDHDLEEIDKKDKVKTRLTTIMSLMLAGTDDYSEAISDEQLIQKLTDAIATYNKSVIQSISNSIVHQVEEEVH